MEILLVLSIPGLSSDSLSSKQKRCDAFFFFFWKFLFSFSLQVTCNGTWIKDDNQQCCGRFTDCTSCNKQDSRGIWCYDFRITRAFQVYFFFFFFFSWLFTFGQQEISQHHTIPLINALRGIRFRFLPNYFTSTTSSGEHTQWDK